MANTTPDEEIIEKRPSNPVATACLVVAALATLTAIVFQVAEVRDVRAKMGSERDSQAPYDVLYEKIVREFKASVKTVLDDNDHPEITLEVQAGGLKAAEAGSPAGAPAETPAAEPTDSKPSEEPAPAAAAEGKTEEPAAAAEPEAPEKAAEGANTEPPAAETDTEKTDTEKTDKTDSNATEKESE